MLIKFTSKQLDTLSQVPVKTFWLKGSAVSLLVMVLLAVPASATSRADKTPGGTSTPSLIVFSPSAVVLNNPTTTDWNTAPAGATSVTVNLTVYDSQGNIVLPTEGNPLHVHVYGAPDGVITPIDSVISSGTTSTSTSVSFTYNGRAFPNNMELVAWMNDAAGGASLGTTLFVHNTRPTCTFGARDFNLEVTKTVPNPIQVKGVVGAEHPSETDFQTFTIDTGSLGVLVTKDDLVMGPNVHGPGPAGQKYYDSSGYIFTGNYYLAPVSVELTDHTFVQSNPILILAVDGVHCDPSNKKCKKPQKADLHYLGVGFDRNSTGTGDLFDSPSENAFLELTDAQNGTDINQGYILSTNGVTVGITSSNSSGFTPYKLDVNSDGVAGDWNPVPGCYQFLSLPGSPQFCGNLLLDVGISEMFMDASSDDWPTGSFDSNHRVPQGVRMNIQAGLSGQPAMSYDFRAVQPPAQPKGPAPTYAQWYNNSTKFVNTGRRPLLSFNYLYSGTCGQVGFERK